MEIIREIISEPTYLDPIGEPMVLAAKANVQFKIDCKITIGDTFYKLMSKASAMSKLFGGEDKYTGRRFVIQSSFSTEALKHLTDEEIGKIFRAEYNKLINEVEKWKQNKQP